MARYRARPAWHHEMHKFFKKGYSDKVLSYSPIVYFPMWEASGVVSEEVVNRWDGAYTGVTLGQTGIGDGRTCPLFDGATDFNNIWSVGLGNAFNGDEATVAIWGRMFDVGAWEDATLRYFTSLRADSSNYIVISKSAANTITFYRRANGGAVVSRNKTAMISVDWLHLALTCSRTANEMRAFINGVQEGATLAIGDDWAEIGLSTTTTNIGCSSTTPSAPFYGWLAHGAIWDSAQSPTIIADLATV